LDPPSPAQARLAEPKLELPEQPLALPRSEFDFE